LPKTDGPTLKEALKRSFEFRSTELPMSFYAEIKKLNTARLERGWTSAVDSIPNAMSFTMAFDQMLKLIGELEGQ